MNREEILAHSPEAWRERVLECHASLPSTNDRALEMIATLGPAAHLAAFFAKEQTAGRGRLGRSWHTAPDLSVACTVVVSKGVTAQSAGLLPLAAALAVADALRHAADLASRLRWPNDVDAPGGKVAGVLVEGRWRGSEPDGFAVGIGVNLLQRPEDFPEELRGLATSVFAETGKIFSRPAFAGALLEALEERIGALCEDPPSAVRDAAPLWAHTLGASLLVATATGVLRGAFAGVGPSGELLLDLGGERLSLIQGEVVRVRS
jgi:BirA family biotin operon repressor/biotin-[acetyl-CoA-carboxylase] ligase